MPRTLLHYHKSQGSAFYLRTTLSPTKHNIHPYCLKVYFQKLITSDNESLSIIKTKLYEK